MLIIMEVWLSVLVRKPVREMIYLLAQMPDREMGLLSVPEVSESRLVLMQQ